MRSTLALLLLALLTFAPKAWAACDAPYDTNTLLSDLVMIETAVRQNDGPTARQVADKMEAGFACMKEPLPYMIVARAYRAVGAGKVLGGDEARGKEWFLTSIELDPGFEYGLEDMGADSPVRYAYEAMRGDAEVSPTQLKGFDLEQGTNYLDGSLLGAPQATLGRPHLFQTDAISGSLQSFIIEGNKFPDAALVAEAPAVATTPEAEKGKKPKKEKANKEKAAKEKPAKEAKEKNPKSTVDTGGFYERKRPPEKTPLIIGGAVTVVGAGALYYFSSVTRKHFDDATTENDVNKYKTATNRLVISSGAVLAVGAGVLTWGIILDDSGRPLPGIHFQF